MEKFLLAAMSDLPDQAKRIQKYADMGHFGLACALLNSIGKELPVYLLKWSRDAELSEDEAVTIASGISNQFHHQIKLVGDRAFITTTNEFGGDEEFFELYVASDTTAVELPMAKNELVTHLAKLGDDATIQIADGRLFAVVHK